ncbi:MAG: hypothetical protein ACR2KT_08660 [Methylocella sp.]|nr:MAG: hypothetical protein DLM68_16640 [Hyphomicrobiales bacterium]
MTDLWNAAAAHCGSIDGAHIKFNAKVGEFTADKHPLADTAKAVFIMKTARIGSVNPDPDKNGNFSPSFLICGHESPGTFPEVNYNGAAQALPAPLAIAELINDDLPF